MSIFIFACTETSVGLQEMRVNSYLLLFERDQSNFSPRVAKGVTSFEGDPEMIWKKSSFAVGPELQINIRGSSLRRGLFFRRLSSLSRSKERFHSSCVNSRGGHAKLSGATGLKRQFRKVGWICGRLRATLSTMADDKLARRENA